MKILNRQLTIEDLEYELPEEQIAAKPASPRSSAKLLVVSDDTLSDYRVTDLPSLLPNNALLIVNETSVLPARFMTIRKDTGGKVEGLFLKEVDRFWLVMLKSNGKLREGISLQMSHDIELELIERVGPNWNCACSSPKSAVEILREFGKTPIPPYILRARGDEVVPEQFDCENYQTVFADENQSQSVAAPTAGLHFDNALLSKLQTVGIEIAAVTLHVGAGTFKGIETQTIEQHVMHFEDWSVSQETLEVLKKGKLDGRPIFAVGTTSVRTLESLPPVGLWPSEGGLAGSTDLMITPPYEFAIVDGILTNFHLPKSTLLTLVAAKIGITRLHEAYEHAISSDFRFYSYGDAMLILP